MSDKLRLNLISNRETEHNFLSVCFLLKKAFLAGSLNYLVSSEVYSLFV